MSANPQVHDKVVCLTTFQNTEIARLFSSLPVRGGIYCIRGVEECDEGVGVDLVGINCRPDKDGDLFSFNAKYFRRIRGTSERNKETKAARKE